MKKAFLGLLVCVLGCGSGDLDTCPAPASGTRGSNPIVPGIFTADPAVMVHDCVVYITAGHDEGTDGFVLKDWYVLSSTDMVTWSHNGGPIMGVDVFDWANANAWAGQMVERDGRFWWYVPVQENDGRMAIGVAVSDSPLGPFEDARGSALVNDAWEMAAFGFEHDYETVYTIDPTVLVEEDGRAWLTYGGFGRMVTIELAPDMVSFAGDPMESTPERFFEAPYLLKKDGRYLLVYAAEINPATIDWSVSDSPFGPWEYQGRIMEPLPRLPGEDHATSHPAVFAFAGQWYLAYHISNGEGGGTYRRQVALEKLFFEPDGSIRPIVPSEGVTY